MSFQYPWVLLTLLAVPAGVWFARRKRKESPGFRFPSGELVRDLRGSLRPKLSENLVFLRGAVIALLIFALARPRAPVEDSRVRTEGIDVVLTVDVSGTMLAEDFVFGGRRHNRLDAVKKVVKEFVAGRENDRIGMVAFAYRPYTVCPLTLDHGWLLGNLDRVKVGLIEDGTAVGSGIMASLNRLKETKAAGKVVILLTDGINNAGKISPLTAAEAARALGIRVYTIGAGTKGLAPYPVKDFYGNTVYRPLKIELDEETLTKIASVTGGRYYRATDTESLRKIYHEINQLEKSPAEEKGFSEYRELFPRFLLPALGLVLLEIILSNTWLRRIP